jgi:uncharacterized protein (DUF433 family)
MSGILIEAKSSRRSRNGVNRLIVGWAFRVNSRKLLSVEKQAQIPIELEGVLVSTPDTLGGSVRFKGTRVPLRALLDTLHEGQGLPEFLDGWPDVTSEQAIAVIRWLQSEAQRVSSLELAKLDFMSLPKA